MKLKSRRQRIILFFPVLLTLVTALFITCKKQNNSTLQNSGDLIKKAQNWFENVIVKKEKDMLATPYSVLPSYAPERKFARMRGLNVLLDWTSAIEYKINGIDYVVALVKQDIKPFPNKNFEAARSLVFYIDNTGNMHMKIIEILSKKGGSLGQNIQSIANIAFVNEHFNKSYRIENLTANIVFYDEGYHHQSSFQLTNGTWLKGKVEIQNNEGPAKTRPVPVKIGRTTCGSCQTWYLVGFLYDVNTGEVLRIDILAQWDECSDSDGYFSGSYGAPPQDQQTFGKLCGNYNFQTVGNSYTGTINNLQWIYRSPQGVQYKITYDQSCLSIANYNINQAQASAIFNDAFNSAVNEVLYELNAGLLTPIQIQLRLKNLTQGNLAALQPGSTWSAIGSCAGNIPVNNITSISYCP